MTGGDGADIFRISTRPIFGASASVHITDFSPTEDILQLSKSAFGFVPNFTNKSITTASVDTLNTALASTSTFVYESSNGYLYWNQNGSSSGFGTGGIFAILDNRPSALNAANLSLI